MLNRWLFPSRSFVRLLTTTPSILEEKRIRDAPPRSFAEITAARKLFSPKHYEKIGKDAGKLLKRDQERQIAIKTQKEQERRQKKQKQRQFLLEKQSSELSKGALKRKISAITIWAKREHPEIWERIVAKISLKESLRGHPWEPAVLLSYEEMEEMKALRQEDHRVWTPPKLGHKYGISALAASKILNSKFVPTPEQRVTRWLEREEFKRIQERFLRSVAKTERSKLIEADLKTRYGTLYSPPPKIIDPLVERIMDTAKDLEYESEYDSDDDENEPATGHHEKDLSHTGGMISVYRRISAEAKAVVAAKLENDVQYQKAFARDVNRIQRNEYLEKERKQLFEEKPKEQRAFFNIFDEDEEKTAQRKPKQYHELKDQPWRQKHITSRKSTRIKQWPLEATNK